MKAVYSILLLVLIPMTQMRAQLVVIDVVNLTQSITNYAVLIEQLAKQATQISNQVRQIQQFETELNRMGDMATVTSIIGFPEFRHDLALPSKMNTWAAGLALVNGSGLFGDTRG